MGRTVGNHLATRLVQIGIRDWFSVPGDYSMSLMDQLLMEPELRYVSCCNELNAAYAADGYARLNGAACVMTTFTVGGLSAINGIAGAYSERLPVIIVTGVPNSNDYSSGRILHHTIGEQDFGQELRCFAQVTCFQVTIKSVTHARQQVDAAISECLFQKKPVLIQVCCNIATLESPIFDNFPIPFSLPPLHSNKQSVDAAVDAAAAFLGKAHTVTMLVGPLVKTAGACSAILELAEACGYPVAVASNGKGDFPETHKQFIGMYWGLISWPYVQQVVESSHAVLQIGTAWNDLFTVAYTNLISEEKSTRVDESRVTVGERVTFGRVQMLDFVKALTLKIKKNMAGMETYSRIYDAPAPFNCLDPSGPLTVKHLYQRIPELLTKSDTLFVDTGDSWFNAHRLRLPEGCGFEIQMQYGSIGWSVPAAMAASIATQAAKRRIINIVGDGAFQMTAQEISSSIRAGMNTIVLLINNQGYTVEEELHSGIYNKIPNWDYSLFAQTVADKTPIFTTKVRTEEEFLKAFAEARGEHADKFCLFEIFLDPRDCSHELLEFGPRIGKHTMRPPVIK